MNWISTYQSKGDKINKVKIINKIMGSGKTNFMLKYMEQNPTQKFMFVTPFLDEVERVLQNNHSFHSPKSSRTQSKQQSLLELLAEGTNIAMTHELFKLIDQDMREVIDIQEYVLILDEVIDIVTPFTFRTKSDYTSFFKYFGSVDEDNFVNWNISEHTPEHYEKGSIFHDVMIKCENKVIKRLKNTSQLVEIFPIENFTSYKQVFILTYRFKHSLMQKYFDKYKVEYEIYTLRNESLVPIEEVVQEEWLEHSKLINILEHEDMNRIGDPYYSLSSSWYKSSFKKSGNTLKKNCYNYFQNIVKGNSAHNMWAVFSSAKAEVKGKGYSKGFVPYNSRATNEFIEKENIAYLVNVFLNPVVLKYFSEENIEIDVDEYALSTMLQYIFRSRIRVGEPINIYIPSKRMRGLLKDYLKGKR